jgi:hypothetical protein
MDEGAVWRVGFIYIFKVSASPRYVSKEIRLLVAKFISADEQCIVLELNFFLWPIGASSVTKSI